MDEYAPKNEHRVIWRIPVAQRQLVRSDLQSMDLIDRRHQIKTVPDCKHGTGRGAQGERSTGLAPFSGEGIKEGFGVICTEPKS